MASRSRQRSARRATVAQAATANPFESPARAEVVRDVPAEGRDELYVVSIPKLVVLHVATLAWYDLYWFYRHWYCSKRHHDLNILPSIRAFFSIFFTHSLFRPIDERGHAYAKNHELDMWLLYWSPSGLATVYVLLVLLQRGLDRFAQFAADDTWMAVGALLVVVLQLYPLVQAQRVANAACGDPKGGRNTSFSLLNTAFLVGGSLFWALNLLAIGMSFAGIL